MAFFANLFKPAPSVERKESQETMERLKKFRGKDTAQWLAKQDRQELINHAIANGGVLPVVTEAPKLEDVDKYDVDESAPYQPPLEVMYTPITGSVNKSSKLPEKRSTQVDWIETIFDEFAKCAREFNSSNQTQQMMVSVNRPQYSFQKSSYDTYTPDAKISVFKGHISTYAWGMLVQGQSDKIEVYVVPSENLLAFTLNDVKDKGFNPFMTIDSSFDNGQLEWRVENEVVSFDKLPFLAKELFRDLIRIASGKMSENELFANYSDGLKLGETVAKGYSAPAPAPAPAQTDVNNATNFNSTTSTDNSIDINNAPDINDVLSKLGSWTLTRDLVSTIDRDLELLNNDENIAADSGNKEQLAKIKEASSDLRSLSAALSELLSKYSEQRS